MRFRGRLGALEERPFRLLWIGRTTSSFGDAITNVALAFAILEISSATALGVVFAIATISRTAFTLIGGVWADRISLRLDLWCLVRTPLALAGSAEGHPADDPLTRDTTIDDL